MKKDINEEIEIPEKTEISIDKRIVTIKGPQGKIKKNMRNKKIKIDVTENKITLSAQKATQREKRIMYSIKAHLKNMIHGVNTVSYTHLTLPTN